MVARVTLPAVSETITFVAWTGIWQSMQLSAILGPIVFATPQLFHLFKLM
jgi:hypothetical protein